MHPELRLRIVVETARAVLDGRLTPEQAAATLRLQQVQIGDRLRTDRETVTRREAEEAALTLTHLADDINDGQVDAVEARREVAGVLGELAERLR